MHVGDFRTMSRGFLKGIKNRHLMAGGVEKKLTLNFLDHKKFPIHSAEFTCNPVLVVLTHGDYVYVKSKDVKEIKKVLGVKYLRIKYWAPLPSPYKDSAIVKRVVPIDLSTLQEDLFEGLRDELGL